MFLTNVVRHSVFGFGRAGSLRRATKKVLDDVRKSAFSSAEVTEISARQFLGLHWVSVGARSRILPKGNQVKEIAARRRDMERVPGAERL